ncbi:pyridoxine 5'-phosphate synthase [Mucisphaera calidilacus]|uniref:Pyridoxine 5'-phosphate synthase n=1 Tax=Mucisphaera calidilacus TaxID=2527982 RepID=A0A518BZE5_9BACT|nr:pyridoxine 5'-phosphate synthase [Mucisphaera calidilacus]QDU72346.1 Pyridoxine 5'-phosphate synthase [Mucisphaera calidilacus]
MSITRLSVNLNRVALLRNQRDRNIPSVPEFARIALDAGADGLTVHPRPDQRHVRPTDVHLLKAVIAEEKYAGRELNIEGNPFEGDYMTLVFQARPHQATLVPDSPDQRTSDHGWNLKKDGERLIQVIKDLKSEGIRVSLFLDPVAAMIERVPDVGADRIELYTEPYAKGYAAGESERERMLASYQAAAKLADTLGLGVNAGHDLDLTNLPELARRVKPLAEVSIGHALTADALKLGMEGAVKAYLAALGR